MIDISKILITIENHGLSLFLLLIVLWYVIRPLVIRGMSRPERSLEESLRVESIIMSLLRQVLESLGGDYVYIWQFTNGQTSLSRIPLMSMSITHQVTRGELEPRVYSGMPASTLSDAVSQVFQNDRLLVTPDSKFISVTTLFRKDGIRGGGIYVSIRDPEKRFLGILAVVYRDRLPKFEENDWDRLHHYAVQIAYFMKELAKRHPSPRRRTGDIY